MPKPIPAEIIEILKRPLPPESIKQHPTKTYLSSIKSIYCVERLNEAFGLNGWQIKNELVELYEFTRINKGAETKGTMVVMKSYLTIPEYEIELQSFGGNDNEDRGDAYKGACTDALTKMCANLYIGMDVYKGLGSGSQAAADAVAKRKIAALKGGTDFTELRSEPPAPAAEPSPSAVEPPTEPKQNKVFSMTKSLEQFAKLKAYGIKELGESKATSIYYRVLSMDFGVAHANQLKQGPVARDCYRKVSAEFEAAIAYAKGAAPDQFDQHMAAEARKETNTAQQ